MKIFKIFLLVCFVSAGAIFAQNKTEYKTNEIVRSVYTQGLQHTELDFYAGTLMLHGISEFSLLPGNKDLQKDAIDKYTKFGNGEIKAKGSLFTYEAGGSGAAFLGYKGVTNSLEVQVAKAAAKLMKDQKRSPEGLITANFATDDKVFIDIAFAITPFLLYSGLKEGNQAYVDMAVTETLELFRILKDNKTGLLHQARGFNGKGSISEDNWSRGNGWGAFALAILVRDLPASHPKYKEVVALAQQFFTATIKLQNKEGLWHQEMTDKSSYVETSGSGLILYGLGIALEKNVLDQKYLQNFKLGLEGYLNYIGSDGSVSHTCFSCLAPNKGTKLDYKLRPWVFNDHHAFGPAVLAFAQASKMGITAVTPLDRIGVYSIVDNPKTPRTYMKFDRGSDVAWENDRIAYRLYGPTVRAKVGNGVDVWTKKVDYPIIDNWYKLNAEGKDYHVDRGEGCDFYHMGKLRGCGAIAVWMDNKPYPSETFDTYKFIKNQTDGIGVQFNYQTWTVPGMKIEEKKIIEMGIGTNLFKVTSTIKSDKDQEITIAVGITTYGKPEIVKNQKKATLSTWENTSPEHGSIGSAVLVNPKDFAGYASYGGDEYVLIKVKTNVPFVYYSGVGWDKTKYFKQKEDWYNYIEKESRKVDFKDLTFIYK
jgi:rhamnogalacturonyl hydrolase YesR